MDLKSRKLWGPERLVATALLSLFIIGFAAQAGPVQPAKPAKLTFEKNSPFYFDGTISRRALENYLNRAITMGYFLVPGRPEGYQFPYRDDDVRMIHNLGAKFVGRAIYRWGEESKLGDPAFLEYAKKLVRRVHSADPEVIFQGCLFEQVSADVNKLRIPAWVFVDFGLPVEDRTFSRAAIIKREGRPDKGGGRGGVPIINNLETRLWFYYLAVSYITIGCEALHLGQVGLIGADDRDLKVYSEFLAKVRTYAKRHARRHMVLMDGHVPSGGMVKDGVSLLDFNSFPMRIKAVRGKWVRGKPQEAVLEVGHLDALFKRSKGCVSPSGWRCDSLPYLVEFDNFGRGQNPNVADPKSMFCWGWDEISWFAQQPEDYRNQWLVYAHDWIKRTDPNGHLQMPGIRMITCPNETLRSYFANTKSKTCPVGYSQEETIKRIWSALQAEKSSWHGFHRFYDFMMDDQALASAEVTAAMQPYLDHYKLAGVIGIIADKNGKVHYKNLLGYADVEAKKPISEDNIFWIASMTKMFAGASIMMLVDESKVRLDDPVTKFIPQLDKWMVVEEKDPSHVLLKPPVRPVTIRHLLSHTSGLAGMSELQRVTGADSTPLKARALSSVTGPLQWQPGDKYAYGNQGMNIAARVVEIVSHMPYETFLQKRFFDPLGMTETSFWPSEAQIARLAGAYGPNKEKNGYARGEIGFLTKPLSDRVHRFPEAGGGLFSTTHDIFRYGLMMANNGELEGKRYLSHAAMDQLRKEQTGKTKVNYSLGYHLRNGMFGHDGAYGTDLSVNPKTGMVAIFMVQCTSGDQWAARDLFLKTATKIFPK